MLPIDRTGWFFVRLIVVYGVLLAPWPGLAGGYAVFYRAGANVLFGSLGSAGQATFQPKTDPGAKTGNRKFDSEVVIKTRKPGRAGEVLVYTRDVPFHTRRVGYLSTALVVALIAATSMRWGRKWASLAVGLVLVHLFIAVEIGLTLLYSLSDGEPRAIDVGAGAGRFFARLYEMMVISPTLTFVVPILIWLLVCVRWRDLERLGRRGDSSTP